MHVLNIIKVNIPSIGTAQTGDSDNCCINRPAAQREDTKQETKRAEKYYTNTNSISKSNSTKISQWSITNYLTTVEYFLPGLNYDSDKKKSAEITQQLQRDFEDVFNRIGCFHGTFLLQLKPDSKPYQAPPKMCGIHALQKPFEEEMKRLQKTGHNSTSRS